MPSTTYVKGQRSVVDTDSGIRPINMSDKLWDAEWGDKTDYNSALFRIMSKMGKSKPSDDVIFRVTDTAMRKRYLSILTAPSPTNTGLSMTLASGEGSLVQAGDMIKNLKTSEVCYVSSVVGDVLYLQARDRGAILGGGAAATATGDAIINLGQASEVGGSAPEAFSLGVDISYNYIGYVRTAVEMSRHAMNSKTEATKNEFERVKKDGRLQHLIDVNSMILHSVRALSLDPSNGKQVYTTGGILQHIQGNIFNLGTLYGGALTERALDHWTEQLFLNGSAERFALCGGHFIRGVSSFAKAKLLINDQMSKKYGVSIATYESGGKQIHFVEDHKWFHGVGRTATYTGGTMASSVLALDLDAWGLRHLRNMDTQVYTNVELPGVSGRKDVWETTIGVEGRPGIDSPYNSVAAPEQYMNPNGLLIGFDTY